MATQVTILGSNYEAGDNINISETNPKLISTVTDPTFEHINITGSSTFMGVIQANDAVETNLISPPSGYMYISGPAFLPTNTSNFIFRNSMVGPTDYAITCYNSGSANGTVFIKPFNTGHPADVVHQGYIAGSTTPVEMIKFDNTNGTGVELNHVNIGSLPSTLDVNGGIRMDSTSDRFQYRLNDQTKNLSTPMPACSFIITKNGITEKNFSPGVTIPSDLSTGGIFIISYSDLYPDIPEYGVSITVRAFFAGTTGVNNITVDVTKIDTRIFKFQLWNGQTPYLVDSGFVKLSIQFNDVA